MESLGPRLAHVSNRLAKTAADHAQEAELPLTAGGQDALGVLVTQAVDRLLDDGQLDNDTLVARAEASLIRVVDELAALELVGETSPPREAAAKPLLDETAVREVVAGLCPGFWPFC